jgi:DNA-directed RNA polymerase specialized sigma24 family protein
MQSTDPVANATCSVRTRKAIEQLFRDGNREALVGELCAYVSRDEAEDLVQRSVERALTGRCHAEHVGAVHLWIRQDARFALSHLLDWRKMSERRLAFEGTTLPRPNELRGPDDDLAQETNVELAHTLVEEAKLSSVDQELVRLYWGERLPRKQVAGELGMAEGTLKKRLAKAGTAFEKVLVRRCGGGCGGPDEDHVRAYAFQHSVVARGNVQGLALAHMDTCEDCSRLFSQLEQVRLAVAAMAPIPLAMDDHSRHAMGQLADSVPAMWDRVSVATRSARHWAAELKAQAICNCSRAVDLAPLPAMRPGAGAAALVTGCLATVGGGVYCVGSGVDPTAGLRQVVHHSSHHRVHEPAKTASAPTRSARAAAAPITSPSSSPVMTPPAIKAKTATKSAGDRAAAQRGTTHGSSTSQREFEPFTPTAGRTKHKRKKQSTSSVAKTATTAGAGNRSSAPSSFSPPTPRGSSGSPALAAPAPSEFAP